MNFILTASFSLASLYKWDVINLPFAAIAASKLLTIHPITKKFVFPTLLYDLQIIKCTALI